MPQSMRARSVTFHRPFAFWGGVLAVVIGVLAHLPMFIAAADMDFHMAGMKMDLTMTLGMVAVIMGTFACAYGLLPKAAPQTGEPFDNVRQTFTAFDSTQLTPAHWKLIFVLTIALIVDVLKPATLGFVVPGAAQEYGLTSAQVAWMPLAGIIGTALGSLLWGYLGDVIGRRASILLAAIVFIGTSICGAMPSFAWNVIMCFLMGLGAGGMLPIAFALLAETVPSSQRGWLIVLVGGIGTIGGYLLASGSAALLEPIYGWRIMWFLGLPTGVILLLLNRYIPESPRYLITQGRKQEALDVMAYFGAHVAHQPSSGQPPLSTQPINQPASVTGAGAAKSGRLSELFQGNQAALTAGLTLYSVAWGLVTFGFLLWLPKYLRDSGMGVAASDAILAQSAMIAFPATILGAWLYHRWSSRLTMVLYALATAGSLIGFAMLDLQVATGSAAFQILLVILLASSSGTLAMLTPYSAEIYPSHIRATGTGWVAASGKFAGVLALSITAAGLTVGLPMAALIVTIPTLGAALMIWLLGIETAKRNLEDIQGA